VTTVPIVVGFYGKLPSHGDFLRRRASDAFVTAWDAWLQEALGRSRAALGEQWLNVYLTGPVWRFAGASGACGTAAVAGVMVPSVDRVGRYFPLTVVAELPEYVNPFEIATAGREYFDRAERVVLETLETEQVDFDGFDREIEGLGPLLAPFCGVPVVRLEEAPVPAGAHLGLQFPLASAAYLDSALLQIVSRQLSATYDPLMLWWTDGSGAVPPEAVLTAGLPDPEAFTSMLDASRGVDHWWSIPAQIGDRPDATEDTLIHGAAPLQYRSAARSHVGKVRTINQDSYVERPEVGIWVVADGLGGHTDGEVASRMVCDTFADLVPDSTFEELIATATERVQQVNDALVRAAERSLLGVRSGSTVAALLTRGARMAILWAGDSRVYRWRDGHLEQLTRDHSVSEEGGGEGVESNAITRAVGGEETLLLDVLRETAQPGDRFLMCSDGLSRVVPAGTIVAALTNADPEVAADALLAATLEAGAPDNVTVLVVDAAA
jgi:type VI secretion system protein ImpM